MKVLVTGATGFVGRWLAKELVEFGHEVVRTPSRAALEMTDLERVREFVAAARPDAIAHLAAISHASDAAGDIDTAFAVNEGGTGHVLAAAADRRVPVLVSGSAEVYGVPEPRDLPLREDAPLRTSTPYGRSKLAQERTALASAVSLSVPVIVTRSFNHTGPGQRPEFVAPAIVTRVLEARRTGVGEVRMGNLDVERDIGDVRDVVRAYRLLLEGLSGGEIETGQAVNVATGRSVSVNRLFGIIARIAQVAAIPITDNALVRHDEAPRMVGDVSRLVSLTGWAPEIPLERTMADLIASLDPGLPSVQP